jgi:hypothetical protein
MTDILYARRGPIGDPLDRGGRSGGPGRGWGNREVVWGRLSWRMQMRGITRGRGVQLFKLLHTRNVKFMQKKPLSRTWYGTPR